MWRSTCWAWWTSSISAGVTTKSSNRPDERPPGLLRDHQLRPVWFLGVAHSHSPWQVTSHFHAVAALAAVAALVPLGAGQVDLGHPAHLLYVMALRQGAGHLHDHLHGVVRVQRGGPQPVECKGIAVHVRTLFEVNVPGERLDVHHGGVGGLFEVQDDECADRPSVCTCTVRHDLDGRLALLSGVGQVAELLVHHARAADDTVDDRLVDDGPEPRPVIAGQDLLPGQADFNQAFDSIGVQLYRPVPEDLAGVVRGLEQAGHDHRLEVADRGGAGFQADVDLVRVRQDIAEGMPPAGLAGVPGQLDQAVTFGAGDAVELEQHPDVAGLGSAAAGLDAEERGGRPLQLARDLFTAHTGGLAAALEFHRQTAAAQGRVLFGVAASGHAPKLHPTLVRLHYCVSLSVGAF